MLETRGETPVISKTSQESLSVWKAFLKGISWTLLFVFVFIVLSALVVSLFVYAQLRNFRIESGVSTSDLYKTFQSVKHSTKFKNTQQLQFLILGVDEVANRDQSIVLTDTILLANLDLRTAQIWLLSVPRDLWSTEYQTKINALYEYGKDRYPDKPEQFPSEYISEITGIPLDYTVIVKLDQVAEIVDSIGGLKIDVPQAFIDTKFPRSDVDPSTTSDPEQLYETVEFVKGMHKMSGELALKYIRSRYAEGIEGSDVSRTVRQQLVIQSLISNLQEINYFYKFSILGKLYGIYIQHYDRYVPVTDLLSMGKLLLPKIQDLSVQNHTLGMYPDNPEGLITHPDRDTYQGLWVYTIRDPDAFKIEVQEKLGIDTQE